jgi:HEAT repeat protein
MKRRLLGLLLSIFVCSALASAPPSARKPTKADIARLVAEAATYQPGQSREPFRRLEELLRQSSSGVRQQLEAGLVQLLSPGSTYEAQEFACTQLGIIGSTTALPALSRLLKSDETAGIACLALTTYPPGKANAILRAALPDARGTSRIQIIDTLGDRRDSKAVKLLAQSAGDADLAVARAAIAALGKIADQAAWKTVVALPKGTDPALQPAITEATLRCAEARASAGDSKAANALYENLLAATQPAYVRRAALAALLRLDKASAQQRILEVVHGSDATLKPVAIADVRALPSQNASEVFAAELPNLQAQEQVWMIDSLAARGDTAACTAIGNSLASPQAAVRRAAIDALGRMGGAWCVIPFTRAFVAAKDVEESRALESAFISLPGGAQTDRAIVAALKKSSGSTSACLITALARRTGPAANTVLLAEAAQSDPVVAKAALRALAKTAADSELSPLLERLTSTGDAEVRSEAEDAAAQAIARADNRTRCSATVRGALGWAQSVDSHIALLGLLPACGDAAALNALKSATTASDTRVRAAAVRALTDWPDDSAWDALVTVYRQPASEASRGLVLRGLVRLAGEENAHPNAKLIGHYRALLAGANSDADLRLILGALGGAAQPEALQLALPLLDNAGVRAEAEAAVKRIAEAIKARHPQAAQEALKRLQSKP